jgi:hypothetical protein
MVCSCSSASICGRAPRLCDSSDNSGESRPDASAPNDRAGRSLFVSWAAPQSRSAQSLRQFNRFHRPSTLIRFSVHIGHFDWQIPFLFQSEINVASSDCYALPLSSDAVSPATASGSFSAYPPNARYVLGSAPKAARKAREK